MTLLFSPFHPFSLVESAISSFGLNLKNPFLRPHEYGKLWKTLKAINQELKTNPELAGKWIRQGMQIGRMDPNIYQKRVDKFLAKGITKLEGKDAYWAKTLKPGMEFFLFMKTKWDKWLWSEIHPTLKIFTAESLFTMYKNQVSQQDISYSDDMLMKDISRIVNDAFGGQEFESYLWANPKVKQMLHAIMFAPDWGISAANIAGATRVPGLAEFGRPLSPTQKDFMIRRYWPAMAAIVLFALPNALQSLIYLAAGDPDEGDKPFNFQNEKDKKTHIDFTPLLRKLPGYEGGDTGQRRVYLRWGKQAYEVFEGWYQNTYRTFANKTSAAVRTAFEQATGTTTSGWQLPFKDQGLMGIIQAEGSYLDSRTGYVAKKFLPMSVMSVIEGRPTGVFAPASRGATFGKTAFQMQNILEAYARNNIWDKISGSPEKVARLETLFPDIVEAALKNGVDAELAMKQAVSRVRGIHYRAFFKALNRGETRKLEQIAESILRLNGNVENLMRSLKRRYDASSRELSDEFVLATEQAFQ